MHPNPIFKSLWQPVLWMSMECMTGALWILLCAMFIVTGLMFAGDYFTTALIAMGAGGGTVWLATVAQWDPQASAVVLRRLRYNGIYPACRTRIPTTGREWMRRPDAGDPDRKSTTGPKPLHRRARQIAGPLARARTRIARVGQGWRQRPGSPGPDGTDAARMANPQRLWQRLADRLARAHARTGSATTGNTSTSTDTRTGSGKGFEALPGSDETASAASRQRVNADAITSTQPDSGKG